MEALANLFCSVFVIAFLIAVFGFIFLTNFRYYKGIGITKLREQLSASEKSSLLPTIDILKMDQLQNPASKNLRKFSTSYQIEVLINDSSGTNIIRGVSLANSLDFPSLRKANALVQIGTDIIEIQKSFISTKYILNGQYLGFRWKPQFFIFRPFTPFLNNLFVRNEKRFNLGVSKSLVTINFVTREVKSLEEQMVKTPVVKFETVKPATQEITDLSNNETVAQIDYPVGSDFVSPISHLTFKAMLNKEERLLLAAYFTETHLGLV